MTFDKPSFLTISKSKNGKGIFTKKDIKQNKRIFEVKGNLIHYEKLVFQDTKLIDNTFRYSQNYYLSPHSQLGDYLNHSCSPNSSVKKIGKKLVITALENIKKGEEIFIDYSTILAADDVWKMKCKCGSSECRRIIKRFASLPAVIQKKYRQEGIVPKYILMIQ